MERKYYRIKTFQEFGNKRPSEWNNNGEMDYLYGKFISNLKEIPEKFYIEGERYTWLLQEEDIIEMMSYTKKPTDVKEGDSFVFVSNRQMNGFSDNGANQHFGKIVTLKNNDGTNCPSFSYESFDEGYEYWDWGHFAPCSGVEEVYDINYLVTDSDCFPEVGTKENPFKNQRYPDEIIGTEYEVISNQEPYYRIGDIVKYKYDDGSSSPLFLNTRTGDEGYITWKRLTKIKTNLNLQQDGSKISTTDFNPESFLCSVSATYSTGSSPVGVAVCYSREEILLGS